jgi:hypothetical protein
MLKQILISTNNNLDKLIGITLKDIEDIKLANHESLFERNRAKDKIVQEFISQKIKLILFYLKEVKVV